MEAGTGWAPPRKSSARLQVVRRCAALKSGFSTRASHRFRASSRALAVSSEKKLATIASPTTRTLASASSAFCSSSRFSRTSSELARSESSPQRHRLGDGLVPKLRITGICFSGSSGSSLFARPRQPDQRVAVANRVVEESERVVAPVWRARRVCPGPPRTGSCRRRKGSAARHGAARRAAHPRRVGCRSGGRGRRTPSLAAQRAAGGSRRGTREPIARIADLQREELLRVPWCPD